MNIKIDKVFFPSKKNTDEEMLAYINVRVNKDVLLCGYKVYKGGANKWGYRLVPPKHGSYPFYIIEGSSFSTLMNLVVEEFK